jgi:hypothetical protein
MCHIQFVGGPVDGACLDVRWPFGEVWARVDYPGPAFFYMTPEDVRDNGKRPSARWTRYVIGGKSADGRHRLYHAREVGVIDKLPALNIRLTPNISADDIKRLRELING